MPLKNKFIRVICGILRILSLVPFAFIYVETLKKSLNAAIYGSECILIPPPTSDAIMYYGWEAFCLTYTMSIVYIAFLLPVFLAATAIFILTSWFMYGKKGLGFAKSIRFLLLIPVPMLLGYFITDISYGPVVIPAALLLLLGVFLLTKRMGKKRAETP